MPELHAQLRQGLADAASLEEAAQRFCLALQRDFAPSLVRASTYVAMPLYRLGPRERDFATALAQREGAGAKLRDETLVLTLLGTAGVEPAWSDRRQSRGHVALPLVESRFVASVPMVASLLQALGLKLEWFDAPRARDVFTRRLVGGFNGLFHVPDARTARDAEGRLVIPAQDFVEAHGVRTVFGIGGSYLNGWITATVLFTRDSVRVAQAEAFTPLASAFKLATMHHVAEGRLFVP
jgi:hypothetical protein